jgi:hypothetical protein
MREEPRFVVSYVDADGGLLWQEEHEWVPPTVGVGIESPDGKRYRIVDVWNIKPKRGPLEYGIHAFLEPVTTGNDRLGQLWPDYYGKA